MLFVNYWKTSKEGASEMVEEMIRAINARSEAEGREWRRQEALLRQAEIEQKQYRWDFWKELVLDLFIAVFAYISLAILFICF